ncbi:DUF2589 domain-containing protein [Flavobacterium sp.]|uniref:DUF2589 domain-containing protein n=1 Tax=Flavobacterium sp. TaxID=239 RepID=UPI00260F90F6|nr:DUF2589 domain-containing protein [Flavobacterium sp.]MDG2433064.1 DUF2589 domain-containing protein [Flavobacterium sp.]
MANPGTELASLDFGNLIGSPLVAVITAQAIAARSTADFIKTVGFDEDNLPIYVDFKYNKEISPYQPAIGSTLAVAAQYQEMKIEIPLLTMLPIPFIKIDLFTLDFNAKITSMESTNTSSDASISGNLEVKQRWPSGSAKLNVSAAFRKTTASGSSVERTYSMGIHVQASQDEMPAGIEKLLNILEGAMVSTPQ